MLFLSGQTAALKSCCCVSRTFCIAAQSQLFHTIAIHPHRKATWRHNRLVFVNMGLLAARRLRAILVQSPHLISHIRRLEIHLHGEVLAEIIGIKLTSLRELQLRSKIEYDIDERAVELAQNLLCLPTIERAELHSLRQTKRALSRLLSSTSPHLRAIEINACLLDRVTQGKDAAGPVIPVTRRIVQTLRLVDSKSMFTSWLPDTGFPFDFTHLTSVEVSSSIDADVASVLRGAQITLRELSLAPDDIGDCPPLRLFPSLTALTLNTRREPGISALLPLLETFEATNCVSTITISIADHRPYRPTQQTRQLLENFDLCVADTSLPALQRVELWFLSHSSTAHEVEFWKGHKMLYVGALAKLSARGLLVVHLL